MEDNNCYEEFSMEIAEEVFNRDLDDVGFEPVEVDDSDSEAAEKYGYNR